jgi:hypothetical protein
LFPTTESFALPVIIFFFSYPRKLFKMKRHTIVAIALALCTLFSASALRPLAVPKAKAHKTSDAVMLSAKIKNGADFDSLLTIDEHLMPHNIDMSARNIAAVCSLALPMLIAQPALAVNGEYGFLEGVFAGMIHPVAMLLLYGVSLSAAYHGIKWRAVRTLADSIKLAKEQGGDDITIKAMQEERSKLISGEHRDKHISLGAILLGTGVGLALEGGLSTYWRVGEIFPGEHLFAGLGLVCIWAISYALAPLMSKGNVTAKNIHFGANLIGLGLFTWQILSGWEGMVNVFNAVPGW